MADVLTPAQRRFNMSQISGRDTKPELLVRHGLHALGLRYKLHDKTLPGRPDLVFPRFKAVVFVHGCFWHAHGCGYSKIPATRAVFWRKKIEGNVIRDARTIEILGKMGWRVAVIWECAVRRQGDTYVKSSIKRVADWIRRKQARDVRQFGLHISN